MCAEYIKNYIQSDHTTYYRILPINNDQADELMVMVKQMNSM